MKKSLLFLVAALMSAILLNAQVTIVDQGFCGIDIDNLSYQITSDGVLTISGTGEMGNYKTQPLPWNGKFTSVIINEGVTSIGEYAFSNCLDLASVTIPKSVTSIKWGAFAGCKGVTSINIPQGVTKIESGTFKNTGLTSINIPQGVTKIESETFLNCTSLVSVTIPESVTYIGDNIFSNCSNLTSVTIPKSVTSIGSNAFSRCTSISSMNIPEKVVSIGSSAFSNCTSLVSVTWNPIECAVDNSYNSNIFSNTNVSSFTLGNNVKYIPDHLCEDMYITKITIPESVTYIGDYAFSRCTSLSSMNIPESVTYIGDYAFKGTPFIESRIESLPYGLIYFGKCLYDYKGTMPKNTSISIKEGTTQIYGAVFSSCSSLASVTIPNSVTHIGSNAFSGCSSLASVTIPNSVTHIGSSAFSGCTSLVSVVWNPIECAVDNSSNSNIFSNNNVSSFILGNNVKSIPDYLCQNMKITEITIPESVTSIGTNTFLGCKKLYYINYNAINAEVRSCFRNCPTIKFTFGNKVKSIPDYLCQNMKIKEIIIPETTTSIGCYAFEGCTKLTSVNWNPIECAVANSYNSNIFSNTNVSSFTFGNKVKSIPDYLCENMNITEITMPESITYIGVNAFMGCTSLSSITIPESVTSIGENAFSGCTGITSVTWNARDYRDNIFTNTNVTSFRFGNKVEYINCSMLCGMKITKINIPENLRSLSGDLNGCPNLDTIMWDAIDYQKSFGPNATIGIHWPTSIKKIIFGEKVQSIPNYVCYNTKVTSINIPESVTFMKHSAFLECNTIDSVIWEPIDGSNLDYYSISNNPNISYFSFGNKVKNIPPDLCENKKITEITIPESVNSIGERAFSGCKDLTKINVKALTPPVINDNTFDTDTYNNGSLIVPEGTDAEYAKAIGWMNFFDGSATAVENASASELSVFSDGSSLHIEGITTDYRIFNAAGVLVYQGRDCSVQLPRGIYIVNTDKSSQKVSL